MKSTFNFSKFMFLLIPLIITWAACSPTPSEETPETATADSPAPEPVQARESESIDLLASGNLEDWNYVLEDPEVKKEDVWTITEEGILRCTGTPLGFLASKNAYKNFKIEFSWRWPESPKNSGFFLRIQDRKPVPKCIEIQLQHSSAGAIMGLGGMIIEGAGVESFENDTIGTIRRLKRTAGQGRENRPGEWNTMSVHVEGGTIRVTLNGITSNACTGADATPGPIGFQSEGGVIEFKDIRFTQLN